jgi:hypothetical protein
MVSDAVSAGRLALYAALRRQWGEIKTNRRALIGIGAVAALLIVYALTLIDDGVAAMRATYADRLIQRQQTLSVGNEKDWPARANASASLRAAYEARLWTAESEGVAIANLSDWVTNAGREAGLERLQVKIEVARPKGIPADYRRLTASVTSQETEAALYAMLNAIETAPHLVTVERLQIQQRPVPRFEATLVAYVRIVRPAGTPAK